MKKPESKLEVVQSQGALIADVREEYAKLEQHTGTMVERMIALGEKITILKARVPHGGWGAFIRENFKFSERFARETMQFWDHRNELAKRKMSSELVTNCKSMLGSYRGAKQEIVEHDANPTRKAGRVDNEQTTEEREHEQRGRRQESVSAIMVQYTRWFNQIQPDTLPEQTRRLLASRFEPIVQFYCAAMGVMVVPRGRG